MIIFYKEIKKNEIKIGLCTLCKQENKYIREFVEHYKKLEVDKIFIYDNNDEDGERIENVILDYINSGFVEIKNFRGKNAIQIDSINHCLDNYLQQYDWILVNDIDEFIHIKEGNIKKFLSLDRLKNCNIIHLNWRVHSDSGQIFYKNESLFTRFPDFFTRKKEIVKSIIRGRKKKKKIINHHVLRYNDNCCNAFGSKIIRKDFIKSFFILNPDYKDYYFDHFYTKSAEEFIKKKNRGDCFFGKKRRFDMNAIKQFFEFNKITLEKIEFFENKTGLNLKKYRKKIE